MATPEPQTEGARDTEMADSGAPQEQNLNFNLDLPHDSDFIDIDFDAGNLIGLAEGTENDTLTKIERGHLLELLRTRDRAWYIGAANRFTYGEITPLINDLTHRPNSFGEAVTPAQLHEHMEAWWFLYERRGPPNLISGIDISNNFVALPFYEPIFTRPLLPPNKFQTYESEAIAWMAKSVPELTWPKIRYQLRYLAETREWGGRLWGGTKNPQEYDERA